MITCSEQTRKDNLCLKGSENDTLGPIEWLQLPGCSTHILLWQAKYKNATLEIATSDEITREEAQECQ